MRRLPLLLLPLSFVVACDKDDTTDTGELVEATSCDFSAIEGTWTGVIPSGETQSMTLDAQAEFDAVIGNTTFSSDAGEEFCSFDMVCKPSATEGTFVTENEIIDGTCTSGWYTMSLSGDALTVGYHLVEGGDVGSSYELTKE
jgi:hypothetical protein